MEPPRRAPYASVVHAVGKQPTSGQIKTLTDLITSQLIDINKINTYLTNILDPNTPPKVVVFGKAEETCNISSTQIFEMVLQHLKDFCPCFPNIRFVNCQFDADCFTLLLEFIPRLVELQSLEFSGCNLNEDQVICLSSALTHLKKNLQTFSLTNNCILHSRPETWSFRELLENNIVLKTLILDRNNLTECNLIELMPSLYLNIGLETLRLNGNQITIEGAQCLAEWATQSPSLKECSLRMMTFHDMEMATILSYKNPSPFIFDKTPVIGTLPPVPGAILQIPARPTSPEDTLEPNVPSREEKKTDNGVRRENRKKEALAKAEEFNRLSAKIKKLKQFDEKTLEAILKIDSDGLIALLVKEWLQIEFNIENMLISTGQPWMSFFESIEKWLGKEYKIPISLFDASIRRIVLNISEFKSFLNSDKITASDVDLIEHFLDQILKKNLWAEHTFFLAVQMVLKENGIGRPIHIFDRKGHPQMSATGDVLPVTTDCHNVAGYLPDLAIRLYKDGQKFYPLIRKHMP